MVLSEPIIFQLVSLSFFVPEFHFVVQEISLLSHYFHQLTKMEKRKKRLCTLPSRKPNSSAHYSILVKTKSLSIVLCKKTGKCSLHSVCSCSKLKFRFLLLRKKGRAHRKPNSQKQIRMVFHQRLGFGGEKARCWSRSKNFQLEDE